MVYSSDHFPVSLTEIIDFFAGSFQRVDAWIFGRNMFGPVRGPWRDNSWKGGW
jgi:hypothetical protein